MTNRLECQFFLVRYVPDPVRAEFVNIGVVLRETAKAQDKAIVRFTRDWTRARCLNPDVDISLFEALEGELRFRLNEKDKEVRPFMEVIKSSFSNAVQVTDTKACLADSLADEIDRLMRIYVQPQHLIAVDGRRLALHTAMRVQFESVGMWQGMQKEIRATDYTGSGDPMRIDCGLPPDGVRRMVHAVSLGGELETAKALAYSMTSMREGVKRKEDAVLELTAIVEPLDEVRGGQSEGDRTSSYQFAVQAMEKQAIRVLTTNDLPFLANAMKAAFVVM